MSSKHEKEINYLQDNIPYSIQFLKHDINIPNKYTILIANAKEKFKKVLSLDSLIESNALFSGFDSIEEFIVLLSDSILDKEKKSQFNIKRITFSEGRSISMSFMIFMINKPLKMEILLPVITNNNEEEESIKEKVKIEQLNLLNMEITKLCQENGKLIKIMNF